MWWHLPKLVLYLEKLSFGTRPSEKQQILASKSVSGCMSLAALGIQAQKS